MTQNSAMLASDMDGTVIPLGVTSRWEREILSFRSAVEGASDLTLAYVTGRDLPLALSGIREHGLPTPRILVCDVGTSVYHFTSTGFEKDREYVRLMEESRRGLDVRNLRHELENIPDLHLQPEDRQTESKLSYFMQPATDHDQVLRSVQEVLGVLGESFQAVYSVGAPHGRGLLDLLPAGVAKDFAVRYLQEHTGVDPDRLVYAGDSGNDLAAMLTGFKVIVVGNATSGLKDELVARGRDLGILDRLYFARAHFAAGVMEGCRHFGIFEG
jgi:HAD superfamily hydrolase (TIGR01484 family)